MIKKMIKMMKRNECTGLRQGHRERISNTKLPVICFERDLKSIIEGRVVIIHNYGMKMDIHNDVFESRWMFLYFLCGNKLLRCK